MPELTVHYNIALSQMIPVVHATGQSRELALLRWGLIPHWAKDRTIGAKPINARAESLAEKAAFRNAYRRRHCLIPADAFYEWKPLGGVKQPYCLRMADKSPFGMVGLWEHWVNPEGQGVQTCTIIITTEASSLVGALRDRMPLIIAPADCAAWLDAGNPGAQVLLKPFACGSVPSQRVNPYCA